MVSTPNAGKEQMKNMLSRVKAVSVVRRKKASGIKDADTAIAWLRGEVSNQQIQTVLWPDRMQSATITMFYCFIARSLRSAYEEGKITIKNGK